MTSIHSMKLQQAGKRISKDFRLNKGLYLLVIPVVAYYILFHYVPMYGITIAFKNFSPGLGILGSEWAGFEHFNDFFHNAYFSRILRNTLIISLSSLVFLFPLPIIFALLLNEVKRRHFAKVVQTISYMPHFISLVVICGIVIDFTNRNGIISNLLVFFGFEPINLLSEPQYFVPIYVISDIWQEMGFSAVIYIAALAGVDMEIYEAARIDGAGHWKQTVHVTIPSIAPTIIILFILRLGSVMNVGFEKILLLYNDRVLETADVISTYVYRKGLQEFNFSYSAAVGLFNSMVNIFLLVIANRVSKKVTEISLW